MHLFISICNLIKDYLSYNDEYYDYNEEYDCMIFIELTGIYKLIRDEREGINKSEDNNGLM